MSKWIASKEDKEAAAGALLILGGMLHEWGLPLDRALEGLRRAYEIESAKRVHACTCSNDRDKELCQNKAYCEKVIAFAATVDTPVPEGLEPIAWQWAFTKEDWDAGRRFVGESAPVETIYNKEVVKRPLFARSARGTKNP